MSNDNCVGGCAGCNGEEENEMDSTDFNVPVGELIKLLGRVKSVEDKIPAYADRLFMKVNGLEDRLNNFVENIRINIITPITIRLDTLEDKLDDALTCIAEINKRRSKMAKAKAKKSPAKAKKATKKSK